jgi:hypothetical protein
MDCKIISGPWRCFSVQAAGCFRIYQSPRRRVGGSPIPDLSARGPRNEWRGWLVLILFAYVNIG